MKKDSSVIFTRPWLNNFFLKIVESSEIFKNLRKIVITEFIEDAERYGWHLLQPYREEIYECPADFSVDEVIKRDRLLRNIEHKTALKMVANCYKQIEEIISRERPKFAFMPTVDHYTTDLFVKVCEHYNVTILPFDGFLDNKRRFRFSKYGEPIYVDDGVNDLNLFEYFERKNEFLESQDLKKLTLRRRIINHFIGANRARLKYRYLKRKDYKNGNFFNLTWYHRYSSLPRFFLKDLFIKDYFKSDLGAIKTSKPIIYISLHVIPEASLDYGGSIDLMDHDEIILKLLGDYSSDYQFILKEHPLMFGLRDLSFYNRIRKIKKAILLTPYYNDSRILAKADVVLTWSGSVGVEAVFRNKKCLNIIKPFYYLDGFTIYPQDRAQLFSDFNSLIGKLREPNDATKIAMNKLMNDISCAGRFVDKDLSDDNISKLVRASEAMIKK